MPSSSQYAVYLVNSIDSPPASRVAIAPCGPTISKHAVTRVPSRCFRVIAAASSTWVLHGTRVHSAADSSSATATRTVAPEGASRYCTVVPHGTVPPRGRCCTGKSMRPPSQLALADEGERYLVVKLRHCSFSSVNFISIAVTVVVFVTGQLITIFHFFVQHCEINRYEYCGTATAVIW